MPRLWVVNLLLLLTLLGGLWGRATAPAESRRDFLRGMPLPYRGWTATDRDLTSDERDLLRPDAALLRRYESGSGEAVELVVIAGQSKRSIHTPEFCLVGDGWETTSRSRCMLPVGGASLFAGRLRMTGDGSDMLVTYFFTDGVYVTASQPRFQMAQFGKRLRAQPPFGALVRILVPIRGSDDDAQKRIEDFARTVLPPLMERLRRQGG